jgi:membrane associated rhomboid family serine protease
MAYSQGFSNPFGFTVTPWVKRLVAANVAVFLVTLVARGLVPYLQFEASEFIPRIWTPITYMFVHGGFFHLLFNMLVLFFFGPPLEERWGSREFLKFYLLTGLGGALLSVLLPYPIIGASAAVYGLLVAFAMYWPDNPIYIWGIFPVKAKWLVAFLVGISIFSAISSSPAGVAHLAHLGGAIMAFVYLKSPWAPPEWGVRPSRRRTTAAWRERLTKIGDRPRGEPKVREARPITTAPRRRESARATDDVDRILEKISQAGIESLTPEERQKLEEASRRYRSN